MPNTMSTCDGPKGNQGTYSCVMWGVGHRDHGMGQRDTGWGMATGWQLIGDG